MDKRREEALEAILASKKYREVCPDTVRRVFAQKCEAHKNLKEADKAARAQLHQITGAFMTPEETSRACALAGEYAAGRREALQEALALHSSTRERLRSWEALFARVFAAAGGIPASVLDLACGLDPIALGGLGVGKALGLDIQGGAVRAVNEWARAAGWGIEARCADLLCEEELPRADMALMMKLLPLLERQKAGFAEALLAACPADVLLVTFPTRTLGGRDVGMARQYAAWMEAHTPASLRTLAQFTEGDELCYVLARR